MLKSKQIALHEWEFVHPEGYSDTLDELERGCDLYRMNDFVEAEKIFKSIVEEIPDHLDGIHHWALVREKVGDLNKAKELWEKAVLMGKKAFPKTFTIGRDLLPWGFIDNRPFLRCLHGLALAILKEGDIILAQQMFIDILKLNPGDNQGVRALAVESFLCLCQPDEALKICDLYPDDCAPEILYGRALAYFQLGNRKEADKHLKQAIEYLPNVAKEIIKNKHKKPRSMSPHYITVGGEDEAYDYWQRNKTFWKDTSGAIDWVKGVLGKKKAKR